MEITARTTVSAYRGRMVPETFKGVRAARPLGNLWCDTQGNDLINAAYKKGISIVEDVYEPARPCIPAFLSRQLNSIDALSKTVQIGAGPIGRGFLAPLLIEEKMRISFLDADQKVIDTINSAGAYTVQAGGTEYTVEDVHMINSITQRADAITELIRSRLIFTSVGPANLPKIAPMIAEGLARRWQLGLKDRFQIIFLENFPITMDENFRTVGSPLDAFWKAFYASAENFVQDRPEHAVPFTHYLKSLMGYGRAIGNYPVGLVGNDPLMISVSGKDHTVPVEMKDLKWSLTTGNNNTGRIRAVRKFDELALQKLLEFNMLHALVAYLGFSRGVLTTDKAMQDPEVRNLFEGAKQEIGRALAKKFGFTEAEIQAYHDHTTGIFESYEDSVFRVGGDPFRKLAPYDRLLGAAKLCLTTNEEPVHIVKGIASAINYALNVPVDKDPKVAAKEFQEADNKVEYILKEICGLQPGDRLYSMIMDVYDRDFGSKIKK